MKRRRTSRASRPVSADAILLALDGGGTRTRCAAVTRAGKVLGTGAAGPVNVVQGSGRDLRRNLQQATRAALADGGLASRDVKAVGAGLAGVFPDGRNREPAVRVLRGLFPRARIVVTGDAVIALRGAIPEGHGVVAVSGTGSSVFGMSLDTRAWARAGGGGPILGDEGSGHRIALDGLRAAWRAHDGREDPTALTPRFARALGLSRFAEAPDVLYGKSMTRDRIAALARVVTEAAGRGDRAALEVLRRAGFELGHAAAAAIQALEMKGRCPVSCQGAVFEASAVFRDAFRDAVRSAYPDADLRAPVLPALGGAFLLGLEALGERATAEDLDALARAL